MLPNKTNFTNVKCNICGKDKLTSKTALRKYNKEGNWTGKWLCKNCLGKHERKNNHDCLDNAKKSVTNSRTGNLNPNSTQAKGDLFQELTCIWRSTISTIPVEDLNKKLDNYRTPIDHSRDSELGIIQTKGRFYNNTEGQWKFGNLYKESNKEFDYEICYCISKDGNIIERIYIIPKKEIINRTGFAIVKNPSKGVQWYEKYRIANEETIKKVNDIWKEMI